MLIIAIDLITAFVYHTTKVIDDFATVIDDTRTRPKGANWRIDMLWLLALILIEQI